LPITGKKSPVIRKLEFTLMILENASKIAAGVPGFGIQNLPVNTVVAFYSIVFGRYPEIALSIEGDVNSFHVHATDTDAEIIFLPGDAVIADYVVEGGVRRR
jgi:hypothetical protein